MIQQAETTMKPMAKGWTVVAALAMLLLPGPEALAAPCAGFTDVDSASLFCPNVEWIKNRSITLGCTSATSYCPDASVSRLAMAAFMNRLGAALTPVQLRVDTSPGAIDLDANAVVCQTGDFAVVNFPRRAYVDLSLSATAVADVNLAADLAYSMDAGATWTNLNGIVNRGSVAVDLWGALSDIGYLDLDVGQNVRWGVRMTRGGIAGTTDLTDSRCQLRTLVYSRDGLSSPF